MKLTWCSNCLKQVPEGEKFCPRCGITFHGTRERTQQEYFRDQQLRRRRRWQYFLDFELIPILLIGFVVVVLGGLGYGVYSLHIHGHDSVLKWLVLAFVVLLIFLRSVG